MINPQNFETVFSALKNRRVLKFKYRPLQKTTWMEREINPLHAVCQKGNWYILGFCHDKQDIRVFNFSRMKDVVETKETFDFPSNFAPEKYFDKEIGIWLSATQKYTVELLISAEIGTFALERSWNKNQKIEQRDDGSVWVSFETTQLPEVKRWVLGQGKTVKVLNPSELIEQVREEVTAVLRMY
jgi:predicted DNA-binding transcriptional regulator YafY